MSKGGSAYGDLGLPILIINQNNAQQNCHRPSDGDIFPTEVYLHR